MIKEATLEKDVDKSSKAKNIIAYAKQQIDNYKGNNAVVKLTTMFHNNAIQVGFTDLDIIFINYDPKTGNSAEAKYPKDGKGKTTLYVYNSNIQTKPKLIVDFDFNAVYHELVHYLDAKQARAAGKAIPSAASALKANYNTNSDLFGTQKQIQYGDYLNTPIEFNAHFFHRTMPSILRFVEHINELPKTFDEFKSEILKVKDVREFFGYLNDDNKKRFLKRIGSYYTSLKSENVTSGDGNIDDIKINNTTQNWIGKFKNLLKLKENQIFIQNNTMKTEALKTLVKKILIEAKNKKNPSRPGAFKKIADKASKKYGSKEAGNRVAGSVKKKIAKKSVKENKIARSDMGSFFMVNLPGKDSVMENILTKTNLQEFAKKIQSGEDMSKCVGVYKNEGMARRLAEELFNHKCDVLGEMKEAEITKKLEEVENMKALMGATQQYYKLKPNLDPKLSEGKIGDLQSQLEGLEKELNELNIQKQGIEESRNGKKKK